MGQACTVERCQNQSARRQLSIPELNPNTFASKYIASTKLAPKVIQVRHTLTKGTYVAYRLAKETIPCRDAEKITTLCRTLVNLQHPNVCRLFEAFDDKWCLYLIYEKVGGKVLFEQYKNESSISERTAANVAIQISNALINALDYNIVHGALHPKNLLLSSSGMLEVTDIGLAGTLKSHAVDSVNTSTFGFLAPEVVQPWLDKQGNHWYGWNKKVTLSEEEKSRANSAADVWSLGVILYNMLCASMPFQGKDLWDLSEKIMTAKPRLNLSLELQELLSSLLKKDPRQRPTMKGFVKHTWIRKAQVLSNDPMDGGICKHLGSLHTESSLKILIMRIVSSKVPTKKVQEVMRSFQAIDQNNDGLITFKELRDGMLKFPDLFSENVTEIDKMLDEIDDCQTEGLSIEELIAATIDMQHDVMTSVLWDAFSAFDVDRSGTLTLNELQLMVQGLEGQIGSHQVELMMQMLEYEIADELTFDEFRAIITQEGTRADITEQLLIASRRKGDFACKGIRTGCRKIIKVPCRSRAIPPTHPTSVKTVDPSRCKQATLLDSTEPVDSEATRCPDSARYSN